MLQASLSMFFHSPVPTTSCHTWCRNHVSFEVPLIASSWPDTDLLPPVHLSFTRPPSLLPPALTSMFEPLPACPIPSRYLTGSKPGLTGGQAVSQAHRREQGLSSLISSSVFPWPQPHRSKPPPTPSTFLLRKQLLNMESSLFTEKLLKVIFLLRCLFCFGACICAESENWIVE